MSVYNSTSHLTQRIMMMIDFLIRMLLWCLMLVRHQIFAFKRHFCNFLRIKQDDWGSHKLTIVSIWFLCITLRWQACFPNPPHSSGSILLSLITPLLDALGFDRSHLFNEGWFSFRVTNSSGNFSALVTHFILKKRYSVFSYRHLWLLYKTDLGKRSCILETFTSIRFTLTVKKTELMLLHTKLVGRWIEALESVCICSQLRRGRHRLFKFKVLFTDFKLGQESVWMPRSHNHHLLFAAKIFIVADPFRDERGQRRSSWFVCSVHFVRAHKFLFICCLSSVLHIGLNRVISCG